MTSIHTPVLAPSLLAGDHGALRESAKAVESLGLKWLHIDIMDGHFVPNLTFGPEIVRSLRSSVGLFFDVHLMLDNPQHYLKPFREAGAGNLTIHAELEPTTLHDCFLDLDLMGCKKGLALNPATPFERAIPFLREIDLLLVMTVQPGFGGQAFRHDVVSKIQAASATRTQHNLRYRIQVDGGIDLSTAKLCLEAGADTFVAGNAFFKADDKEAFVHAFANHL